MPANSSKDLALVALLNNPTVASAAKACGLGENTLYRFLADAEFSARLAAARKEVLAGAIERLQGAAGHAVETLIRNMGCGNPATEIRAASLILDHAIKAHELVDLMAHIERLEAAVASLEVNGGGAG